MVENWITFSTRTRGNRVDVDYHVDGEWKEAFNVDGISGWWGSISMGEYRFWNEYPDDVSEVPKGILAIPFLCNILPIAWMYGAKIHLPEIDEDFLSSVEAMRSNFQRMIPNVEFKSAEIVADRIQHNHIGAPQSPPLVLFSGGVDAVFAAVGNRALKPTLVNIFGADMFFKNESAWKEVDKANLQFAETLGMSYASVKSTFRYFLNYKPLNEKFGRQIPDDWWHAFQHGLGLLGLVAPLAYKRRAQNVVIGSTYSPKESRIVVASDPTIDVELRFGGCKCQHYDYTISRQEKIEYICQEAVMLQKPIPLRVCWESGAATNCCFCDKCIRTYFAVLAEGYDPANYGFDLTPDRYAKMVSRLDNDEVGYVAFWKTIADKLRARNPSEPHVLSLIAFVDRTAAT